MLHDIVLKGSTDRSVTVRIIDSTDGTPETGVVFNTAGIALWYRREGATVTSITEATLAGLTTAHSDGGFLHVSDGVYRLDLPDAAFASGANYVDFGGTVTGMIVIGGRVRLVDVNIEDTVRAGLTALPNVASGSAGAIITSGTGTAQLSVTSGVASANAVQLSGDSAAADNAEAFFDGTGYAGTNNVIPLVTTTTTATNVTTVNGLAANVITAAATAADFTTEIQAGLATAAALATVDANVDAILVDTGTTLPATLATIDDFLDTEVAAILADTNELQTDWANGGRLDLILDARASQASVDTVDGIVDAILVDTGTTLDAAIAAIDTNVDAILVDTGTDIPASIAAVSTQLVDVLSLVESVAIAGGATYQGAASYTLTTGTQSSGTFADVATADAVYHQHTDAAGALELYYQFDMGASEVGVEVLFRGRIEGANDSVAVQAYDWIGADWETLWTQAGVSGSTDTNRAEPLLAKHTGTGGNDGLVRIRFYAASGLSTATLYVDQLLVSKVVTEVDLSSAAITAVQSGLATASALTTVDTVVDAIKVKTDQLTFTKTNEIDANVQSINGVTITGDGGTGTEFGV